MESLISTLGIDRLPEADRIQLVDEILESLGEDREPPPITEAQARELDRRLARLESGESKTSPADEVIARISAKLRR